MMEQHGISWSIKPTRSLTWCIWLRPVHAHAKGSSSRQTIQLVRDWINGNKTVKLRGISWSFIVLGKKWKWDKEWLELKKAVANIESFAGEDSRGKLVFRTKSVSIPRKHAEINWRYLRKFGRNVFCGCNGNNSFLTFDFDNLLFTDNLGATERCKQDKETDWAWMFSFLCFLSLKALTIWDAWWFRRVVHGKNQQNKKKQAFQNQRTLLVVGVSSVSHTISTASRPTLHDTTSDSFPAIPSLIAELRMQVSWSATTGSVSPLWRYEKSNDVQWQAKPAFSLNYLQDSAKKPWENKGAWSPCELLSFLRQPFCRWWRDRKFCASFCSFPRSEHDKANEKVKTAVSEWGECAGKTHRVFVFCHFCGVQSDVLSRGVVTGFNLKCSVMWVSGDLSWCNEPGSSNNEV